MRSWLKAWLRRCVPTASHAKEPNKVNAAQILEIRNAEASHAVLIKECRESLGADPTAQTPCTRVLVTLETGEMILGLPEPI